MDSTENISPDELSWQAFRYISGEMLPAEVDQFEERLAVDQVVREAVADEVRRSQAVVQVFDAMHADTVEVEFALLDRSQWSGVPRVDAPVTAPVTVPTPHLQKRQSRMAGWIGAAIAASLAFALILHFAPRHQPDDTQSVPVAAASNGALATIWAESDLPADRQDEWHDGVVETARSGSVLDEAAEITVPEWMLAAVSVQTKPNQQPEDRLQKN